MTGLAIAGAFDIIALVVALGGALKLVRPLPTEQALQSVGLPHRRGAALWLGATELVLGSAAFVFGGRVLALALGIAYTGFGVFVAVAMRQDGNSRCGCFGRADTPPTMIHLILNVVSAGVAVAAFTYPVPSLEVIISEQPAWGLPYLGFVLLGTYLVYIIDTALPEVLDAGRGVRPADPGPVGSRG
ncbi:MAG: hypothetical protein JJLCMIEE_01278 [Acidimicrobiales bacterium]|nr:MAG: hypothetical protein EDR02_07035 [Actinomycetota bacterium]MBV6508218.1 hypothetical protein [Acidimicrobiales bacterium]RIK07291.1 MAG: hypothetical protein DCC48_04215 [Acidobacteriota bacterium]